MTRTRNFPTPDLLTFVPLSPELSQTRKRTVFPSWKGLFHSVVQSVSFRLAVRFTPAQLLSFPVSINPQAQIGVI